MPVEVGISRVCDAWLTLSMDLRRRPTFPSWSLQRMISLSPGRISALLMPTSAPVTGRTIPPTPERDGTATCYGGKERPGSKKGEKVLRQVEKEQSGGGRGGERRIREEWYMKIQPEIKGNVALNKVVWGLTFIASFARVTSQNASDAALENFIKMIYN